MKSLLFATLLTSIFAFIPVKSIPPDPNKRYSVTISRTLPEWQAIIQGIGSSDQLSAKFANNLTQEIADQLNQAIAKDTTRKDSTLKRK